MKRRTRSLGRNKRRRRTRRIHASELLRASFSRSTPRPGLEWMVCKVAIPIFVESLGEAFVKSVSDGIYFEWLS